MFVLSNKIYMGQIRVNKKEHEDLVNQKDIKESLEETLLEYEKTIDELHVDVTDLQADVEAEKHKAKVIGKTLKSSVKDYQELEAKWNKIPNIVKKMYGAI